MIYVVKEGWELNPNKKIVRKITEMCKNNNGECPCHNESEDKHCPCSDYMDKDICHCGLYLKKSKRTKKVKENKED